MRLVLTLSTDVADDRNPNRAPAATPVRHWYRRAASGLKAQEDGRLEVGPRPGIAHLLVSRDELRRALLVLQGIIREAEQRGYSITASEKSGYGDRAGVAVVIREHSYTIEIQEVLDRVPLTEAEIAEWERRYNVRRFAWEKEPQRPQTKGVPSGKLRVSLPSRWHGARCNWTEGPRGSLEEKLPELFAELERRADEDDERVAEVARREAERQRLEKERFEREQRARIEQARVERLRGGIELWRLVHETRRYVAALRARLPEREEPERERIAGWCEWAEEWAAANDPVANPSRIRGLDDERGRLYSPR